MLHEAVSSVLVWLKLKVPPSDDGGEITENNLHLLETGEDSDIVLLCEEEAIRVHKHILVAHSDVFQSLLDSLGDGEDELRVSDIRLEPLKQMIHFLYSGEVPELWPINYRVKLLEAADRYAIGPLKRKCLAVIQEGLDEENVCGVLNYAAEKRNGELKDVVISYLVRNRELFSSDTWREYSEIHVGVANNVMMSTLSRMPN